MQSSNSDSTKPTAVCGRTMGAAPPGLTKEAKSNSDWITASSILPWGYFLQPPARRQSRRTCTGSTIPQRCRGRLTMPGIQTQAALGCMRTPRYAGHYRFFYSIKYRRQVVG